MSRKGHVRANFHAQMANTKQYLLEKVFASSRGVKSSGKQFSSCPERCLGDISASATDGSKLMQVNS